MSCIVIHTVKILSNIIICFCINIANKLIRSELSLSKTISLINTFCDCVTSLTIYY